MAQYGLQPTMYKAENSQMFQNQFVIQDRGGQENRARRVQEQLDQRMQEVAEPGESDEDSNTVGTEEQEGGQGGAPWRAPEEEEEAEEEIDQQLIQRAGRRSARAVGRKMAGKGFRVDLQA